jgi:hypothetical protein
MIEINAEEALISAAYMEQRELYLTFLNIPQLERQH